MASKGRKKPSLYDLTRQPLEDFESYLQEIGDKSDRACALVTAAALDHVMIELIRTKFNKLEDDDDAAIFFGEAAPVGTFAARTMLSFAFGFIDQSQKSDLDSIRRIRNAFAHAAASVRFDTKLIANECDKLKNFQATNRDGEKVDTPKKKYVETVHTLYIHLTDKRIEILKAQKTCLEALKKLMSQPQAPNAPPEKSD
jgi:hypothetical protein